MEFEDFIRKGVVRKARADMQLVKSLVKMAESDIIWVKSSKIDKNSARKILTGSYDILRSIVEAMYTLDGYKVYSHEAFTFYLIKKGEVNLANKFDRFRKIRNGINYYGKNISVEEVKEYVPE